MRRILINLHPLKGRGEPKILKFTSQYAPFAFLGLVILVVINLLLFILSTALNIPYKNLKKEWVKLAPQVDKISSSKRELQSLIEEKAKYQKLLTSEVLFSRILSDIFSSLPKNIWLKTIESDSDSINFIGFVVKWKENPLVSVDKFIKNLTKQNYFFTVFQDINLKSSRRRNFSGVEVVEFSIECRR
jgi:Tfp pilus assembly protein PilN